MKNIYIYILIVFSFSVSAQELQSDETLGEMVRNTSVEMLIKNEAILQLNAGEIDKARKGLCTTLETNLLVLKSLSEHAPKIESKTLRKSVAHIANSRAGCSFSDDVNQFLEKYK